MAKIISLILRGALTFHLRVELAAVLLLAPIWLCAQDVPAVPAATQPADLPPLDGHDRMQMYLKSLVSPYSIGTNILFAGYDEGRNFPHEWGRTGTGFAKRLGSQFAQDFLDKSIELGVGAIHHEDNRYARLGEGRSFMRRFGNVAKSTVVVSSTHGGQTLALGQIAGAYGAWAIASQVWEPPSEQRTSRILIWGSVDLAAKGGYNLLKEFGPDLKKKLHP